MQLTDEGMIPDAPRGVDRDVVDLHAWAEVYVPGGGWVGLDATSGLLCGEGHIPLACTARPAAAAPLEGTSDAPADKVVFEMKVGRLGHEPRPTAPFTDEVWSQLTAAGEQTDAALHRAGIALTVGGEPTFTSRLHPDRPEWSTEALGESKWVQGRALAAGLRARLAPGGVVLHRFGKHYPGESLPRWALDIIGRRDGTPLVRERMPGPARAKLQDGERLGRALAGRLGLGEEHVRPAYEDPWHQVREESRLPVGVDPHDADLESPEDRRRLARLLDRGLATAAGFVLPLAAESTGWRTETWPLRRERLYLVPGDSPIGLRLPLDSIIGAPPPVPVEEPYEGPPDPRRGDLETEGENHANLRGAAANGPAYETGIRTTLCFEVRDGHLFIFLPPLATVDRFCELVRAIDDAATALDLDVIVEGYPPAKSPDLFQMAVTPDPGVLEVNIPPTRTAGEHASLMNVVFDVALGVGLQAERFQIDGRQAGSGGGNHVTLGGPTPLASPFVQRPDLLASLLTFTQHHPSLSYLFTGLFVGPTSQAPRLDEARTDAIYDLELALARAHDRRDPPPPWLSDALFRHLLVDVSGSTHRTEICIDKLFDPLSPYGRQGLVELRAFEMPPHVRMAVAQVALVRALVASFAATPYQAPPVRWGQRLHDQFLLPTWLWRDFEQVIEHLDRSGVSLPPDAYRVFLELRCPVAGTMQVGDVKLEIRNALEPWNVLGEEVAAGAPRGTSTRRWNVSSCGSTAWCLNGTRSRSTATRCRCGPRARPASSWAAFASAPGRPRTPCTRTSGSTTRCASIWSIDGASARSARSRTTCGTPKAARTTSRRSRASRRRRGAPAVSPSRARRHGRRSPGAWTFTRTRRIRWICAASRAIGPCPSPSPRTPPRGRGDDDACDADRGRDAGRVRRVCADAERVGRALRGVGRRAGRPATPARGAARVPVGRARACPDARGARPLEPGRDLLRLQRQPRLGEDLPVLRRAARRRRARLGPPRDGPRAAHPRAPRLPRRRLRRAADLRFAARPGRGGPRRQALPAEPAGGPSAARRAYARGGHR